MDSKDRNILKAIQNDANLTVSELAKKVNLSTSSCWRRVQSLEESGVIKAKVTLLDQKNSQPQTLVCPLFPCQRLEANMKAY